jgi:MOSC domain-containing protein YiiM
VLHQIIGKVLAIAVRTAQNGPMREVAEVRAETGGGLDGDVKPAPHRGISLITAPQWRQVQQDLHADLPWHTRRANVLLDMHGLAPLIGKQIEIGELRIEVKGETRPCGLMDELHQGLRAALVPDCRGGVHGQILRGGTLRIGDPVRIAD